MYNQNSMPDFGQFVSDTGDRDVGFYPGATAVTPGQVIPSSWNKPRQSSMVWMFCIGGGAGGGGGFTGAASAARGGGGSGASSGWASLLIPAMFIPDQLLVIPGTGGAGGGAGAAGGGGLDSFIATGNGRAAYSASPNMILKANNAQPGGGGGGTGAAGGAAGTVPTIAVATAVRPWSDLGMWQAFVGLIGVIGGAQTGAAGTNAGTGYVGRQVSGGASGGGVTTTDFAGGNVLGTTVPMDTSDFCIPTLLMQGGAAAGGAGITGMTFPKAGMTSCGGSGGGTSNSGVAGAGGDGAFGCGGGGGGGGATGGAGGRGGPGIVIIISW